jgi:nucleotide-binding universal stress UspA family protein
MRGSNQPVVVALHGDSAAETALHMAFEEAHRLDTRLIALHASPHGSPEAEIAEQTANLTEQLAGWKQDYPEVNVDSVVVVGDEDAKLLQWSRSAAVVIVERPRRHWWNSWTHSVVGEVLKQTHCPLIVVPYDFQPTSDKSGDLTS